MDDQLSNSRSSLGIVGQISCRTKFQPVRIKALLDFCESDDDENEEKERDAENESDADDPRPLSPNLSQEIHNESTANDALSSIKAERAEEGVNRDVEGTGGCEPEATKYKESSKNSALNMDDGTHLEFSNAHLNNEVVRSKLSQQSENMHVDSSNRGQSLVNKISESTGSSLEAVPFSASMQRALDTPLKHAQENMSARPNPCLSHRNIFQTPQSKIENSFPIAQSHTPATILSQWKHNGPIHTPLQSKGQTAKEYARTPSSSMYGGIVSRQEPSRFFGLENKTARRPLADAMCASQQLSMNDKSSFPFDSKKKAMCALLPIKTTEVKSEHSEESSIKRNEVEKGTVDIIERKFAHLQTNATTHASALGELKENHHPNLDMPKETEKHNRDKMFETKLADSCAYNNARNSLPQRTETDGSACSKNTCNEPQYPVHNERNVQQKTRQVVEPISQVQFSIPSSVPKQQQYSKIVVKSKEYLILGTLGQGMSGQVLRVKDMETSELRAIKCVNLSRMEKESAQGCLDEISMLHKLQASCVVRMFDYEIKHPMVYVVMEMGDTDLSGFLRSMAREKQLPLTMILYYWTEMLTAVKHIHDNGVIHSDLKPANFLLVRGRLKLIDFGIASSVNSDMTSVVKNCPVGTLNYISPEALMDTGGNTDSPDHKVKYKISYKSDVWSLGCILYSLVYGHTPFHNIRSQWAKVNAITNPKLNIVFPTSPSSSETAHMSDPPPPVLVDVMRKCLQHDPKARPTVAQLLKIQYVPTKELAAPKSTPNISGHILVKIKQALNEEEWRHFIQILEQNRQP